MRESAFYSLPGFFVESEESTDTFPSAPDGSGACLTPVSREDDRINR